MSGWDWQPLGEVCKTGSGATPLKTFKEYYDGGAIPWLLSGEVAQGEITEAKNFITELGLKNSAAKLFPENSILIAMYGATAGQVGILRFKATTNQAVCAILPSPRFVPEFLFYVFLHLKESLVATATGNAQPNISQIKIKNTLIPVLSLEEQRRIVAVLDETFAAIATATANAEKNLANARELFASELDALIAEAQANFPSGPLIDQCLGMTVGHVGPMKNRYEPDGIPFLRSQNVRPFEISFEGMMFIDDYFDAELKKSRLCPGDVAVVRTGYPGTAAVIPPTLPYANCSDLVIIRPGKSLNPHFVAAFLNSNIGKRAVSGELVGAAQKHFNVGSAKQVSIPLPSLEQQAALVDRVAQFSKQSGRLAEISQARLDQLAKLKVAILHRAFTGELTATMPDTLAA